ncbi:MAG TPA: STAS domain-containing protein [Candidatus Omnitrophota bacterium]|nr:STAS domain-containing protein [Candidatus Omnitrophota bacterium]HPD84831.1 STAS domain-containing protein [Candidatus Omnitrophota bacterium]HRZ03689.1 STAS domain-containing protein [Candidatus Omnitrophota bacterium]
MESKFSVSCTGETLKVELCGRLDASNAEVLQAELKKNIGQKISKLVFFAKDLEYISSAGLRVIIFAKQKVGVDAHIFLIGAQEGVLNVIKMSGLDTFMTTQEAFNE